jgi:hypothetical protein
MVESTIEATPISTPMERVVTYSVVGAGAKLVSPVHQERANDPKKAPTMEPEHPCPDTYPEAGTG